MVGRERQTLGDLMGSTASAGGLNGPKPGSQYLGGTVIDKTTYTGQGVPAELTQFNPTSGQFPTPQPGSSPMGDTGGSPYAGLWTGLMLGSLLSQAMNPMAGGAGGPMGGGMMPMGAPSTFGPGGFTPGLRGLGGIGSIAQAGAPAGSPVGGSR